MENKKPLEKRCSIKLNNSEKEKKHVLWDDQELEQQELEKKLNPKIKITEPKTPYAGNVIIFSGIKKNILIGHNK